MFVVDGSFSVGNESFEKVKQWLKDVTEGFDITQQVQVGVVSLKLISFKERRQHVDVVGMSYTYLLSRLNEQKKTH